MRPGTIHHKTHTSRLIIAGLAVLIILFTSCRESPRQMVSGSWIGLSSEISTVAPGEWLCFRKNVELYESEIKLTIAADTKYWMWVNGELVIREGGLTWGPHPKAYYQDTITLDQHLKQGENVIEIIVWYWGKEGFAHKTGPQAAMRVSSDVKSLVSDSSWSAAKHPALSPLTGDPYPNWRHAQSNVLFDGSQITLDQVDQALWGYEGPWHPVEYVSALEKYEAVNRPIPQWKDFGLTLSDQILPITADSAMTLTIPLAHNAHITGYMEISAPMDSLRVEIFTDNLKGGNEYNFHSVFLTGKGRQVFETPNWINGHELRFKIPQGVTVHDLGYRETGYQSAFEGNFSSSDSSLNKLWDKAARTLYVTMRDNYMDCPDRERAQWWGDVVLEMEETFYCLDRNSDQLSRKAIKELLDWQKESGVLFSPVPAGKWDKELPTQMLASVGKYGIWNYYLHTGDKDMIVYAYPIIGDYLRLYRQDADGMIIKRQGGWTWGDWGDNKDMTLIFAGWYALALEAYSDMAALVGDQTTHDSLSICRERLTLAARATWQGDAYISADHEGSLDGRAQALMVLSGMADTAHHDRLITALMQEANCSPYFEKYVLEALYVLGRDDLAVSRMKSRFGEMIDSKLTTLWEGWSLNDPRWGGGTYNHAWSGGGLSLLSKYGLGVIDISPAYDTITIDPRPGHIKKLHGRIPSIKGPIDITVDNTAEQIKVNYEVPKTIHVIEAYDQ